MTKQTLKALSFIKDNELNFSNWNVADDGLSAFYYTNKEEYEIIALPAHIAIYYTDGEYDVEDLSFLKSAPITLKTDDANEYAAIFPLGIED